MRASATLKAGDWVEVKTSAAIRRTLDHDGRLDEMPFMPEMLRFCGRRYRVFRRAHKTCDTIDYVGGRRLANSVHLEGLRCDGEGHGSCHALCMLFWKEAWLRKVDGPDGSPLPEQPEVGGVSNSPGAGCTEEEVLRGTRAPGEPLDAPNPTYVCQATKLLDATVALRRSDLAQYVEDVTSGNVGVWRLVEGFGFYCFELLSRGRYGLATPSRWIFDNLQRISGGWPYPGRQGKIPKGGKTPSRRLDLRAGEMVRVRALPEILATVDEELRNRGMGFHTEMVPFTGRNYRVLRRIERIVHEKTGKMIHLKNDTIILEDAVCQGRYIDNCRQFCPRSTYLYFREIWLERAEGEAATGPMAPTPEAKAGSAPRS